MYMYQILRTWIKPRADYDGPKRKIGYVGVFVTVFGFVFSSKSPHHSVNLNFDWSTIKWSTGKTQLESHHCPSNVNFVCVVNRAPKFIWARAGAIACPQMKAEIQVEGILKVPFIVNIQQLTKDRSLDLGVHSTEGENRRTLIKSLDAWERPTTTVLI